tara:strand:- start:1805 stop:4279 length:2475 start_codon:yes stop_codon:yes gene_type:complete
MAKFYQRQSTGGRFDRKSVGDLGLRALKEQQDQILESLKLQRLRSFEYGKQNIKDIESSKQKEQNWKEELQQLETKIHNNKVKNITKRGEDEADILLTKAEEYKRESEFWQDFAPKFAKGLGSIAQGIEYELGKRAAAEKIEEWEKQGGLEQYHSLQDEAELYVTDELKKQITDAATANYAHDLWGTAKVIFERDIGNRIINSGDEIFNTIKAKLDADENVDFENFTESAYRELDKVIEAQGIDKRSKSARNIKTHLTRKIAAEATYQKELFLGHRGTESTKDLKQSLVGLIKDPTSTPKILSSTLYALAKMKGTAYTLDDKGQPIKPETTGLRFKDKHNKWKVNYAEAIKDSIRDIIPELITSPSDYTNEQELWDLLDVPTDDGKTTVLTKHHKTFREEFSDLYSKRVNELTKSSQELEKAETKAKRDKAIKELFQYDLNEPEDRRKVMSLYNQLPLGSVARSVYGEQLGYDPAQHDSVQQVNNLELALLEGRHVEAVELWSYLPKKGQQTYLPRIKDVQELMNAGITYESVHDYAKAEVELISKKDKLTGAPTHSSNKDAIEGMTDAYFYYNNQLREKFPDVKERETEIKIKLQADLDYKNSDNTEGRGWARRSTPSSGRSENNVVWSNYVPEIDKNTLLTTDNVKESLAGDTNTLKDLLNYNENGNIVKQDDLDRINDVILEGRGNFPKSENVDYLSARYNMTRRDVWNQILTHKYGKDATIIPPGPEELAIHQIEQSTVILPNSTKHYSTENKVRLGVLTKLVESQAAGINAFMKKELTNPVDWTIVPTSNRITEGYKYVDINGDYPIYNPLAGTTYFAE